MYYSLDQGNQRSLILDPGKNQDWLDLTRQNYSWEKYNEEDNRLDEYMEYLFDCLPELGIAAEDDFEFWQQLTRGQKMFYSLLVFEGSVEEGGIFQFFWDRPEHIYAFAEALEALQIQPLLDDYNNLVDRYETMASKIEALQNNINFNNKKWEQLYNEAYEKGMSLFGVDYELGAYFFEMDFKKSLHQSFCDFIEKNPSLFLNTDNL